MNDCPDLTPEKKVGVLDTHAGSSRPLAETMEIFSKEIYHVLSLVKYPAVKILIFRTVPISFIRHPAVKRELRQFLI